MIKGKLNTDLRLCVETLKVNKTIKYSALQNHVLPMTCNLYLTVLPIELKYNYKKVIYGILF
jgi:hypothetical protein